MRLLSLTLLLASHATTGIAQENTEVSVDDVTLAIAAFGADPASERGKALASVIVTFAEESDAVEVKLDEAIHGWLAEELKGEFGQTLLTAIIAGSVRSQIETGVTGDDAYSGLLFLLRVYRQVQAKVPEYTVPEIDEQLAAHRRGTLHELIADRRRAGSPGS